MNAVDLRTGQACAMPQQTVLCLGNFDGVHRGHRALIAEAKQMRDARFPRAALGVFCFHGLSSDHLSPTPPEHLTSEAERLRRFLAAGAEVAIFAEFPALRDLPASAFIHDVLMRECRCVAAVCGFNHRFGKGGEGTPELLKAAFGDAVLICDPFLFGGGVVSSTRIRKLLKDGHPELAAELLIEPYVLEAPVVHGAHLGRTIGFPTINQRFSNLSLIPKFGVYLTDCEIDGAHFAGLADVGTRPTVSGESEVRCETFLPNFAGDLYGKTVRTSFLRYLRGEKKFDSVDDLRRQIQKDLANVKG